nr:hypothetical protein [Peribacillus simplex]
METIISVVSLILILLLYSIV